jgi:hypothetical protein
MIDLRPESRKKKVSMQNGLHCDRACLKAFSAFLSAGPALQPQLQAPVTNSHLQVSREAPAALIFMFTKLSYFHIPGLVIDIV